MKRLVLAAVMLTVFADLGSAQDARGFLGAAVSSSVNREWYAAVGGGMTIDLGTPWLSGGGQAEALISLPYVAGRGAIFGQFNVIPRSHIRPFVLGGAGFGEDSGRLVGAGIEFRDRANRYGFRMTVEDYLTRYETYSAPPVTRSSVVTGHQIAIRGAMLF